MTNALIKAHSQQIAPTRYSFQEIQEIASVFAASGIFKDTKGMAACVVKIMFGQEMGFGPMASMTGVHFIEGKPVIGANLMAAAIKNSGRYDYKVRKLDATECLLEFFENGVSLGLSGMTMAEALEKGLCAGYEGKIKANWAKFPKNMLFARAMSNGFKWYCPDASGGTPVYTPDEFDQASPIEDLRSIPGEKDVTSRGAEVKSADDVEIATIRAELRTKFSRVDDETFNASFKAQFEGMTSADIRAKLARNEMRREIAAEIDNLKKVGYSEENIQNRIIDLANGSGDIMKMTLEMLTEVRNGLQLWRELSKPTEQVIETPVAA